MEIILTIVVVAVWAIIVYLLGKWTIRFMRHYDGPEFIWAGSGTVVGISIGIALLLTWGAFELTALIN